jgi:hypothetical protein
MDMLLCRITLLSALPGYVDARRCGEHTVQRNQQLATHLAFDDGILRHLHVLAVGSHVAI